MIPEGSSYHSQYLVNHWGLATSNQQQTVKLWEYYCILQCALLSQRTVHSDLDLIYTPVNTYSCMSAHYIQLSFRGESGNSLYKADIQ